MIKEIDVVLYRLGNTHSHDAYIKGTLCQAETMLRIIKEALVNSDVSLQFVDKK
jgi:hypothetical protein